MFRTFFWRLALISIYREAGVTKDLAKFYTSSSENYTPQDLPKGFLKASKKAQALIIAFEFIQKLIDTAKLSEDEQTWEELWELLMSLEKIKYRYNWDVIDLHLFSEYKKMNEAAFTS
jgi:hypothetical protein